MEIYNADVGHLHKAACKQTAVGGMWLSEVGLASSSIAQESLSKCASSNDQQPLIEIPVRWSRESASLT
jgi:hypothetical protein